MDLLLIPPETGCLHENWFNWVFATDLLSQCIQNPFRTSVNRLLSLEISRKLRVKACSISIPCVQISLKIMILIRQANPFDQVSASGIICLFKLIWWPRVQNKMSSFGPLMKPGTQNVIVRSTDEAKYRLMVYAACKKW